MLIGLLVAMLTGGDPAAAAQGPAALVGTYRWADGSHLDLWVWQELGKDRLVAFDDVGWVRALTPAADGTYTAAATVVGEQVAARVRFEAGTGGVPTRLVWTPESGPARTALRVPARAAEVRFASGALELAGTLFLPEGSGPHPALVLLHGSGPQDRYGTLPFAHFLVREGIALLAFDKRGVGGSAGDWMGASFEDLAGDARAAVAFLRAHPEVDPRRIGLFGVSQGGWIGPLAAAGASEVALVVSVSGPGTTPAEQSLDMIAGEMRAEGLPEVEVEEALALVRLGYRYGAERAGWEEYAAARRRSSERSWFPYLTLPDARDDPHWELQRRFYFHDPAPALAALRCPLLALFGGKDLGVPAEKNRAAWQAALARGGNLDPSLVVLPAANHLMWSAGSGSMFELAGLDGFVPEYRAALVPWLRARFGR